MHVYFKQRDGARQVLNCHELQIAGRQLLLCARALSNAAYVPRRRTTLGARPGGRRRRQRPLATRQLLACVLHLRLRSVTWSVDAARRIARRF